MSELLLTRATPYKVTPVFDQNSLPQGLRRAHRTKAGVWGLVRVTEGRLRLSYSDGTPERVLTPDEPGLLLPEQEHQVEPVGAMRMRVEFYDRHPLHQQGSSEVRACGARPRRSARPKRSPPG